MRLAGPTAPLVTNAGIGACAAGSIVCTQLASGGQVNWVFVIGAGFFAALGSLLTIYARDLRENPGSPNAFSRIPPAASAVIVFCLFQFILLAGAAAMGSGLRLAGGSVDAKAVTGIIAGLTSTATYALVPINVLLGALLLERCRPLWRAALWFAGTLTLLTILGQVSGFFTGNQTTRDVIALQGLWTTLTSFGMLVGLYTVSQIVGAAAMKLIAIMQRDAHHKGTDS